MTNQPPQTLDEIIAAGNEILTAKYNKQERIQREKAELQARIHKAILTAAARYIPPAVLEFATVYHNQESADPWRAHLVIELPRSVPVFVYFTAAHIPDLSYDDPECWNPFSRTNNSDYIMMKIQGEDWTGPISDLPMVLASACERYTPPQPAAPQPEPKPEPPAPVGFDLYQGLINMLDRADIDFKSERKEGRDAAAFNIAWVTARALVGICVNLEDIAITLGREESPEY